MRIQGNLCLLSFYLYFEYLLAFKYTVTCKCGRTERTVPALAFKLGKYRTIKEYKFLTWSFILLLVCRPPIYPSLTVLGKWHNTISLECIYIRQSIVLSFVWNYDRWTYNMINGHMKKWWWQSWVDGKSFFRQNFCNNIPFISTTW